MEKHKQRSHRTRKIKSPQPEFWRRNSLEIAVVVLILAGIYLLVEKTDVSENILHFLKIIIIFLARIFSSIASFLQKWIEDTEASDIVGYILILTAVFLLGYRTRTNLLKNYRNTRSYPKCESGLSRIHRKFRHKIIGFLFRIRVKNYRFLGSNCSWQGIQITTL
ncbi:MAG: hypothetical protein IIA61_04790 [Candidatus Marinimicrobia bacterium]|nr:hypothetical protein [Candidatus Neomarinimicrobiota bacterium]